MEYERAAKAIKQSKSVAVFAHTNPDGDTLGSAVALYLALKKAGKDCGLFCDEILPLRYASSLPCSDAFELKPSKKYDLAVAVDCAGLNRLGQNAEEFSKFKNSVNIDHHFGNEKFATVNITENTSSAAELILNLIETLEIELDAKISQSLFIGLSTDTGSFQHANTTANSFAVAAELVNYGADPAQTAFEMFKKSPLARTKLLGRMLSRIRSYLNGQVSLIYSMAEDFKELGLDKSATEFFVDFAISVEGTAVGIALCQCSENVFKASLRSRGKVDVSEIASHFGGGGHKQAAGCIVSGFFEDVIDKLVRQISFSLNG